MGENKKEVKTIIVHNEDDATEKIEEMNKKGFAVYSLIENKWCSVYSSFIINFIKP